LQIKTKIVSCHTADSIPVKQEVIGTVILPPLVFPGGRFVPSLQKLAVLLPTSKNFSWVDDKFVQGANGIKLNRI
jgi:hypothetical protein